MASSMIGVLTQQLGQEALTKMIAQRIGMDEATVRKAVKIGLPLILAALARNTANPSGAAALSSALKKDHDGSLLDNLGGFFQGAGAEGDGNAILKHVLGADRGRVETEISQATGLDSSALAKLLPLLAPLVLAQLGKVQKEQDLGPTDLSAVLRKERDGLNTAGKPRAADGDDSAIEDESPFGDSARAGLDILTQILGARS